MGLPGYLDTSGTKRKELAEGGGLQSLHQIPELKEAIWVKP
jgi:hypothetical protein